MEGHNTLPELRRRPSNLTASFITGTDSTTSNIYGPGRVVGKLLSSSGRRLENLLGRTAQRLGYGPPALVYRLLTRLREQHGRFNHYGRVGAKPPPVASAPPETGVILEDIICLANEICPTCGVPTMRNVVLGPECRDILGRLLGMTGHSTVSARRMSYELIYALCITHRSFRDTLLELGALSRIRATADEVRFFAFEETHLPWDTLAPISQSAMRGLQEDPLLTASALPLVASDIHKFMRLPEFRNGVLQLVSNTRSTGYIMHLSVRSLTALLRLVMRHHDDNVMTLALIDIIMQTLHHEVVGWLAGYSASSSIGEFVLCLYQALIRLPWTGNSSSPEIRQQIGRRKWFCFGAPLLTHMCTSDVTDGFPEYEHYRILSILQANVNSIPWDDAEFIKLFDWARERTIRPNWTTTTLLTPLLVVHLVITTCDAHLLSSKISRGDYMCFTGADLEPTRRTVREVMDVTVHNRPLDPIYPLLLCDIMQCPFTQSQVTTEQALLAFLRETLTNSHVSSWWSQLNVLDSTGENHLWRLLQLLYDQTCMNAEIHPHHEDLWIWECLILPFVVWLSKQDTLACISCVDHWIQQVMLQVRCTPRLSANVLARFADIADNAHCTGLYQQLAVNVSSRVKAISTLYYSPLWRQRVRVSVGLIQDDVKHGLSIKFKQLQAYRPTLSSTSPRSEQTPGLTFYHESEEDLHVKHLDKILTSLVTLENQNAWFTVVQSVIDESMMEQLLVVPRTDAREQLFKIIAVHFETPFIANAERSMHLLRNSARAQERLSSISAEYINRRRTKLKFDGQHSEIHEAIGTDEFLTVCQQLADIASQCAPRLCNDRLEELLDQDSVLALNVLTLIELQKDPFSAVNLEKLKSIKHKNPPHQCTGVQFEYNGTLNTYTLFDYARSYRHSTEMDDSSEARTLLAVPGSLCWLPLKSPFYDDPLHEPLIINSTVPQVVLAAPQNSESHEATIVLVPLGDVKSKARLLNVTHILGVMRAYSDSLFLLAGTRKINLKSGTETMVDPDIIHECGICYTNVVLYRPPKLPPMRSYRTPVVTRGRPLSDASETTIVYEESEDESWSQEGAPSRQVLNAEEKLPATRSIVYIYKSVLQDELDITHDTHVKLLEVFKDGWGLCEKVDGSFEQGVVPLACLGATLSTRGKFELQPAIQPR